MLFLWALYLFALIAMAGAGIAALAALVLAVRKTKSRAVWKGWVGVPLGCGCAPFLALTFLVVMGFASSAFRPSSWMFEEVFGVAPGTAITGLQGSTAPGFDSRDIYLSFDRTDAALRRLDGLMTSATRQPFNDLLDSDASQGDVPVWWRASSWVKGHDCPKQRYRGYENYKGWPDLVIVECLSDGHVYVLAHRID
jgi:hypothetical protein